VCGSRPELGNWDPAAAPVLRPSPATKRWLEREIEFASPMEGADFRYVVTRGGGGGGAGGEEWGGAVEVLRWSGPAAPFGGPAANPWIPPLRPGQRAAGLPLPPAPTE